MKNLLRNPWKKLQEQCQQDFLEESFQSFLEEVYEIQECPMQFPRNSSWHSTRNSSKKFPPEIPPGRPLKISLVSRPEISQKECLSEFMQDSEGISP